MLELEPMDWCQCVAKTKMYWDRPKSLSFSASESLMSRWAALTRALPHKQPNSQFSWRLTWQDDFCHLEAWLRETGSRLDVQVELTLVDTSTSWDWVDTERLCELEGAQQVMGHWHWDTIMSLCIDSIVVKIVRGNLTFTSKNATACPLGILAKNHDFRTC